MNCRRVVDLYQLSLCVPECSSFIWRRGGSQAARPLTCSSHLSAAERAAQTQRESHRSLLQVFSQSWALQADLPASVQRKSTEKHAFGLRTGNERPPFYRFRKNKAPQHCSVPLPGRGPLSCQTLLSRTDLNEAEVYLQDFKASGFGKNYFSS